FKQAATLAVNSIQNEAICAEQPVKSYSTTLLATVALRTDNELFAAAFWLGDGAIGAYSPSGKVRILGNPDSGEYAGQTRFLDQSIIADPSF
ncbi:protein phosphatase 2C domain-containing protein, partial [Escherichia coli]|nr:protein phosphatase 2C domain-containing protein [Escherichia coli]